MLAKGDIRLKSSHHLHLTNKGDPGKPGIIIVTSESDASEKPKGAAITLVILYNLPKAIENN